MTRPEIKEYIIVKVAPYSLHSHDDLIKEVNKRISEGWQPIGGVAQTNAGLSQAMVR